MRDRIRIEGRDAFITLTQGYVAVIDAVDVPLVEKLCWYARVEKRPDGSIKGVYAGANTRVDGRRRIVLLHRLLLAVPGGVDVDHRDGDGLNNRRHGPSGNLRLALGAQNAKNRKVNSNNTSGAKGVTWCRREGKWYAQIQADGKKHNLGYHSSVDAAAAAYASAAKRLHGDFGRLA